MQVALTTAHQTARQVQGLRDQVSTLTDELAQAQQRLIASQVGSDLIAAWHLSSDTAALRMAYLHCCC